MISSHFLSIPFTLYFLVFIFSVFFSFYLPGVFILQYVPKLQKDIKILLASVIGMVLWGIQGYIFGYIGLRWLSYIYIAFFLFYFLISYKSEIKNDLAVIKKGIVRNKFIALLISCGVIIQLIPVFGSGFRFAEGIRFFGVNGVDGVMHLAFIEGIASHFPPVEPGAYDNALTNYHYWSDLIISEIARVWHVPITHLFFQFFPFFTATVTGIISYQVIRTFGWPKIAGIWFLFFIYFSGDAAYLLMLIVHKTLSFSAPAIDNGATQFLNIPHAMAKLVFLTSLIPLHFWITNRTILWGIVTVILFASLIGIKVYFGIFALFGFMVIVFYRILKAFYYYFKKKKIHEYIHEAKESIIFSVLLLAFAAVIYLPPNKASGGLGFYPLEWPKIFLGPGALNWGEWWLRRQVYEEAKNYRNLFVLDIVAIIVALISIHGTRLVGLLSSKEIYRKLGIEKVLFFIPGLIFFHFLGLFTLQKSGGFNVFNFFAVSTVILSLFSALFMTSLRRFPKSVIIVIVVFIVITTIPRVIYEASQYINNYIANYSQSALISNDELEGFEVIRNKTPKNAIIQSHPKNPRDSLTPYVSFFSGRLTYLTGVGLQETHNQPIQQRKIDLKYVFDADNSQEFHSRAKKRHIDIIYLQKVSEQQLLFNPDNNLLEKIFENRSVVIYRIT